MFFALAVRLPAYQGALAARLSNEQPETPVRRSGGQSRPTYGQGSRQANVAATAASAPPADRTALMLLNSQLGGGFFSHTVVKGG